MDLKKTRVIEGTEINFISKSKRDFWIGDIHVAKEANTSKTMKIFYVLQEWSSNFILDV